jgi:hypothetical protein
MARTHLENILGHSPNGNHNAYPVFRNAIDEFDIAYLQSKFAPTTGTSVNTINPGCYTVTTGAISHPLPTSTNLYTQERRMVMTSGTSANAGAYVCGYQAQIWRGNAARMGGFLFHARYSQVTNVAATRAFVGVSSSPGSMYTGDPSAAAQSFIGVGFNSTDSNTNWRAMWKNGTTYGDADISSGAVRSSEDNLWDLFIGCYPNDSYIAMSLYDVYNDAVALAETKYSTNIPLTTALLIPVVSCGCASAGSAVALSCSGYEVYCPW